MGNSCSSKSTSCCAGEGYESLSLVDNMQWSNAVRECNINAIQVLHNHDPDVIDTIINDKGETALHVACRNRKVEIVEYLLKSNAQKDIKARKTWNTPLNNTYVIYFFSSNVMNFKMSHVLVHVYKN